MFLTRPQVPSQACDDANVLFRHRIIAKTRLNRRNLAERLRFESSVLWETARFVNQVLVFAFLLLSLKVSSNEVQQRGIFENLKYAFDFEALQSITSRQDFVIEGLPLITAASKDYFLLSSNYFDDNGVGSKQLIRNVVSFNAPASAGQLTLSGAEFSLTAWIRTGQSFLKGYILQKPTESGLSCWGWFVPLFANSHLRSLIILATARNPPHAKTLIPQLARTGISTASTARRCTMVGMTSSRLRPTSRPVPVAAHSSRSRSGRA
eukprot:937039-Rhodomonas_salina.2